MAQPSPEGRSFPRSGNGLHQIGPKSNLSRSTLSENETAFTSDQVGGGEGAVEPGVREKHAPSPSGGTDHHHHHHSGISKLLPGGRRRRRKKQEKEAAREAGNGAELLNAQSEDSLAISDDDGRRRRSVSDPGRDPTASGRSSEWSVNNSSSPAVVVPDPSPLDPSPMQNDLRGAAHGNVHNSDSPSDRLAQHGTRAATLEAPEREGRRSISKSPSRGSLQSAYAPSPNTRRPESPDRTSTKSSGSKKSKRSFFRSSRRSSSAKKTQLPSEDVPPVPAAPQNITTSPPSTHPLERLKTPPSGAPADVMATVTPPTPTDGQSRDPPSPKADVVQSPDQITAAPSLPPNAVISPSGNMISHRRVRSASAAPNKPSNGVGTPAAAPGDEGKPAGSREVPTSPNGSGFFSSMFSAAQNAASSLSSTLNAQPPRQRSSTENSGVDKQVLSTLNEAAPEMSPEQPEDDKKELAVDTLGTGDLDFSQLGIDTAVGGVIKTKDGVVFTKMNQGDRSRNSTISQRDELAAKIEDAQAARAVDMAYEKPLESATSVADDTVPESQLSAGKDSVENQSPSQEKVHEDVDDGVQRSGSARNRRHRQLRRSSGTAGTTVGAIGAAVGGLALPGIPGNVPRLTGFAVASKKRNREFHQLFRSVPEDDYLIEDYSCALQREIILAGRLYISEGHVCFSSNILGWVTTLVIGFDEVVAIEKESTAMVFPNAIAVKTLHARHTFRSLLSRDSTYDLMVNIWKISHPTLKSSVNGTQIAQGTGDKTEKTEDSDTDSESASDVEEDVYDEDEERDGTTHGEGLDDGTANSEHSESKVVNGKSPALPTSAVSAPQPSQTGDSDAKPRIRAASGASKGAEFPGPKTHSPTEFTDPSGYYEKMVKDEVIPAPLGQVYSLIFGPMSGSFLSKFLVSDQKVTELQLEDDKVGLTNENRTRSYSYIKPLNASMGPKQTKCITIENLDFLDLEKAILVTLTTQTPDVPSGNVFSVKTKYVFTWAQGNATRFYMSCTVEWTGKSWIKGPIEKGANDGQLAYGTDLVKALRLGVTPRTKLAGKGISKARKLARANAAEAEAAAAAAGAAAKASSRQGGNWGILEPLRGPLGPILDTFQPLFNGNLAIGIICMLMFMMWFRTPSPPSVGQAGVGVTMPSLTERMIAYEELWRREESDLWNWLEDRVGMNGPSFPVAAAEGEPLRSGKKSQHGRRSATEKEIESRLRGEQMTEKQIEDAIRLTHERLESLQRVVEKRKGERAAAEAEGNNGADV